MKATAIAASATPQAKTTVTLLCPPRVGSTTAEPDFGADRQGRAMMAASAPETAPAITAPMPKLGAHAAPVWKTSGD